MKKTYFLCLVCLLLSAVAFDICSNLKSLPLSHE